jgi:hypothetical protein
MDTTIVKRYIVPASDIPRVLEEFDALNPSMNATVKADADTGEQILLDFLTRRGYLPGRQPTPSPPLSVLKPKSKPRAFLVGKRTTVAKTMSMDEDNVGVDEKKTTTKTKGRRLVVEDDEILQMIRALKPPSAGPYTVSQLATVLTLRFQETHNVAWTTNDTMYKRIRGLKEFQTGELAPWVVPGRRRGGGEGPKVKPFTTKKTTASSSVPHGAAAAVAAASVRLDEVDPGSDSESGPSHGGLSR